MKKLVLVLALTAAAWTFGPHVAIFVFNEMAREVGVKIRLETRIEASGRVFKTGAKVTALTADNGDVFQAKIFLDATYKGDLMA